MKHVLMLAAAAAALSMASTAQAAQDPMIALVDHLCVANHGNLDRVRAAAMAEGWKSAPPGMVMAPVPMLDTSSILVKGEGDAQILLVTGTGLFPGEGRVGVNSCGVAQAGPDVAAVKAALHSRLGFAPIVSDATIDLYGFSEKDGANHPFTVQQDDEAKAAAGRGDLSLYYIVGTGGKVVVIYGVSTGAQP